MESRTSISGSGASARSLFHAVHGSGDPILLVHGFPLSGAMWDAIVPGLSDRWKLIVPDLRGHGASTCEGRLGMTAWADDLADLLAEVEPHRPVTLVGFSMGGYVAFEFLRRHPGRLSALVLASTRVQADSPEQSARRTEMAQLIEKEGRRVVPRLMLPNLFRKGADVEVRRRCHDIMAATSLETVTADLAAMAARPDATDVLARSNPPTQIIVGAEDELTPVGDARFMHELVPGSRIEVVPECGHMCPMEQPAVFTGAVRRFLEDLAGD